MRRIANVRRPDRMATVEAWLRADCPHPEGDDGRVHWLLGKAEAALMQANTEINRLEAKFADLEAEFAELEVEVER